MKDEGDSPVERLRNVADDIRRYVGTDEPEVDEDTEHVAPLERTLEEKHREKMERLSDELEEK